MREKCILQSNEKLRRFPDSLPRMTNFRLVYEERPDLNYPDILDENPPSPEPRDIDNLDSTINLDVQIYTKKFIYTIKFVKKVVSQEKTAITRFCVGRARF